MKIELNHLRNPRLKLYKQLCSGIIIASFKLEQRMDVLESTTTSLAEDDEDETENIEMNGNSVLTNDENGEFETSTLENESICETPMQTKDPVLDQPKDPIVLKNDTLNEPKSRYSLRQSRGNSKNQTITCTACGQQVNHNMKMFLKKHPVLEVLLCRKCFSFHNDGVFSQDENGVDEYCRWCAEGGNLICCDFCHNAFCKECIRRNFGRKKLSEIMEMEFWRCFVCDRDSLQELKEHCLELMANTEENSRRSKKLKRKVDNALISEDDLDCDDGGQINYFLRKTLYAVNLLKDRATTLLRRSKNEGDKKNTLFKLSTKLQKAISVTRQNLIVIEKEVKTFEELEKDKPDVAESSKTESKSQPAVIKQQPRSEKKKRHRSSTPKPVCILDSDDKEFLAKAKRVSADKPKRKSKFLGSSKNSMIDEQEGVNTDKEIQGIVKEEEGEVNGAAEISELDDSVEIEEELNGLNNTLEELDSLDIKQELDSLVENNEELDDPVEIKEELDDPVEIKEELEDSVDLDNMPVVNGDGEIEENAHNLSGSTKCMSEIEDNQSADETADVCNESNGNIDSEHANSTDDMMEDEQKDKSDGEIAESEQLDKSDGEMAESEQLDKSDGEMAESEQLDKSDGEMAESEQLDKSDEEMEQMAKSDEEMEQIAKSDEEMEQIAKSDEEMEQIAKSDEEMEQLAKSDEEMIEGEPTDVTEMINDDDEQQKDEEEPKDEVDDDEEMHQEKCDINAEETILNLASVGTVSQEEAESNEEIAQSGEINRKKFRKTKKKTSPIIVHESESDDTAPVESPLKTKIKTEKTTCEQPVKRHIKLEPKDENEEARDALLREFDCFDSNTPSTPCNSSSTKSPRSRPREKTTPRKKIHRGSSSESEECSKANNRKQVNTPLRLTGGDTSSDSNISIDSNCEDVDDERENATIETQSRSPDPNDEKLRMDVQVTLTRLESAVEEAEALEKSEKKRKHKRKRENSSESDADISNLFNLKSLNSKKKSKKMRSEFAKIKEHLLSLSSDDDDDMDVDNEDIPVKDKLNEEIQANDLAKKILVDELNSSENDSSGSDLDLSKGEKKKKKIKTETENNDEDENKEDDSGNEANDESDAEEITVKKKKKKDPLLNCKLSDTDSDKDENSKPTNDKKKETKKKKRRIADSDESAVPSQSSDEESSHSDESLSSLGGVKFLWETVCESVDRMKTHPGSGCILAHCMGLGKTLQVIAFIHTLLSNKKATKLKTCLVVCPLNTILNWYSEFDMWLEAEKLKLNVYELASIKNNWRRADTLQAWHEDGGVLIMGYDMFRNLVQEKSKRANKRQKGIFLKTLIDPGPDVVVCDEGHILKNDNTALAKAMTRIASRRRIVLTGTPLQNNLSEYHCMVQFVKPNLLGTRKEFQNRFLNPIVNGQCADSTEHDVRLMKRRAHILHNLLDGCVQRRDYNVLTPFLPPKYEYVISIRLSEVQVKLYKHFLDHLARGKMSGSKGSGLFADYQGLMKIWTHPYVLKLAEIRDENKAMYNSDDSFIDDESCDTATSTDSEVLCLDEPSSSKGKGKGRKGKSESEVSGDEVINNWRTRRRRGEKREEDEEEEKFLELKDFNGPSKEWWTEIVSEEDAEKNEASGKIVLLFDILQECEAIGDKVLVFSQSLLSLELIERTLAIQEDGPNGSRWVKGVDYFRMDGSTSAETRKRCTEVFNDEDSRVKLFLISTRAGGLGINLVSANRVVIFDASWNPTHDVQSIFRVYRFGQKKPVYIYRFLAQASMEEKIYDRQITKLSLACRVVDEQQIERHFNAADLQELYNFEPDAKYKIATPIVPKDRLLAELLLRQKQWISSYHEHDSLLENKASEELTEEERKAAWAEYEAEKKGLMSAGLGLLPQGQVDINTIIEKIQEQWPGLAQEELNEKVDQVIVWLRQQAVQQRQQGPEVDFLH
uniref:ATP-dependent helicase ATRX n=1 Tax=Strigamia maritima TaxID=126957 RepID=T1IWW8_STRMM